MVYLTLKLMVSVAISKGKKMIFTKAAVRSRKSQDNLITDVSFM